MPNPSQSAPRNALAFDVDREQREQDQQAGAAAAYRARIAAAAEREQDYATACATETLLEMLAPTVGALNAPNAATRRAVVAAMLDSVGTRGALALADHFDHRATLRAVDRQQAADASAVIRDALAASGRTA